MGPQAATAIYTKSFALMRRAFALVRRDT